MTFVDSVKLILLEHINNFKQISSMATNDLKKQYSGTLLGYFWSLIKNLIYVFAYWFMIVIGLKSSRHMDYPYIVWLVVGLTPWFFIRDTLLPAATSIRKNKYLVTKMVYPISTISTFKVIAGFISGFSFLIFMFLLCLLNNIFPTIYWIQVIYYVFAAVILLSCISLITSTLVVVSRDIEFLISSMIVIIFWFTPILWPISNVGGIIEKLLKLNPFLYIVEGFRDSILNQVWFWERPHLTIYFWVITLGLFLAGSLIHGKLRNYFADML